MVTKPEIEGSKATNQLYNIIYHSLEAVVIYSSEVTPNRHCNIIISFFSPNKVRAITTHTQRVDI